MIDGLSHPVHAADLVIAAALDPAMTIDEDGCLVDLKPAAPAIGGYRRIHALGHHPAQIPSHRVTGMRADGARWQAELPLPRTAEMPPRFTAGIPDLSRRRAAEAESTQRKALLEQVERLARIGSWRWNPTTGELRWSDTVFHLLGLVPAECVPTPEIALSQTHPDDRAFVADRLDFAKSEGELPPTDLRIVRPDGAVRHLRTAGGMARHERGEGHWLLGAVQDVTEQRRAERELAAHLAVSEALAVWDSFETGGERVLRELATALDFAVAALWLPLNGLLAARVYWSAPWIDTVEFERATRELRLPFGTGLPGRAWTCRQPIDLASLDFDERCVRREAAAHDRLRTGVAIPALNGDRVLGVVELYSGEPIELTERLVRLLTGLGYELGAFLAQRRGELKPLPLTARELEILQLAAQGLSGREIAEQLVIARATVKTHFEHIYAKLAVSNRVAAVAHAVREGLIE